MVTRSFRCLVFAGLLFLSTGGACGEAEAGEGGSLFSERRQRHEDLVARDPTLGAAMEKALAWLAAHQSPNGSWSGADAVRQCNGEPLEQALDGAGEDQWTVGLTGLALLGFLGTGRELGGSWAYEDTVRRGIAFLLRQQSDEGYFGPHLEFQGTYNHAVATLAMLEAVGMGAGPAARASAERAVAYILHTRTPGAGWRYTPVALQTDVSVTTWMFLCLHTATQLQENETRSNGVLGVEMSPTVRAEVRAFVESLTDPTFGRVGYIVRGSGPARHRERIDTFPAHRSESMTAAGLLTRALAGEELPLRAALRRGMQLCSDRPPRWNERDGSIDMYYWLLGSMASYLCGGSWWGDWGRQLRRAVLPHQRTDGGVCGYEGSWDPAGAWGPDGGRVYSTSVLLLALQTPSRFPRP